MQTLNESGDHSACLSKACSNLSNPQAPRYFLRAFYLWSSVVSLTTLNFLAPYIKGQCIYVATMDRQSARKLNISLLIYAEEQR